MLQDFWGGPANAQEVMNGSQGDLAGGQTGALVYLEAGVLRGLAEALESLVGFGCSPKRPGWGSGRLGP